ncbi:DUF642 domain-containing protein [Corallincola luteus]|uniref:DUF642 domain-containing protein n=1 Tax=Corallincola luteus TaxID=1775177 RepID=A0ABY2AIT2_9GAMM|nr:DUF642 domain-containing protein [Corallincola luteus]TCI02640.1 DUF642 domain-containing protein [Corallincola luteus]
MLKTSFVVSFLALLWAPLASANLIVNGSFDQFEQTPTRSWSVYQSLTGWQTTAGSGIEVGKYHLYTSSNPEDDNPWVVELDSYNNSAMQQTVQVEQASLFELSFSYAARTNRPNDNIINVGLLPLSPDLASFNETKRSQQGWQTVSYKIWLQQGAYDLELSAGGISNSLGGLIDNVRLIDVDAPATPLLASLALFGLLLPQLRRRGE